MKESKRERVREFKICVGQELLLVKILFEEVHFQASFKDRNEGKECDGEKGKKISDLYSREANLTATLMLGFVGGDAKDSLINRRTQKNKKGHRSGQMGSLSYSSPAILCGEFFLHSRCFYVGSLSYTPYAMLCGTFSYTSRVLLCGQFLFYSPCYVM